MNAIFTVAPEFMYRVNLNSYAKTLMAESTLQDKQY